MQHKNPFYRNEPARSQDSSPHKTWLDNLDRFSVEEQLLIAKALEFATTHHAPQRRVSGEPYIIHPVAVAQILIDKFNADVMTVAAALLHDTVEDTSATLDDIELLFGVDIRFIVDGTTDVGKGDGREHIEDKHERADRTHHKVHEYAIKDSRIYLVKIADRWHNMTTCSALRFANQERLAMETMDFHVPAARKLGFDSHADELELLARKVCDIARKNLHK